MSLCLFHRIQLKEGVGWRTYIICFQVAGSGSRFTKHPSTGPQCLLCVCVSMLRMCSVCVRACVCVCECVYVCTHIRDVNFQFYLFLHTDFSYKCLLNWITIYNNNKNLYYLCSQYIPLCFGCICWFFVLGFTHFLCFCFFFSAC